MKTFEEIYKAYSADIYRFAMYKLHDKPEAEDVVSETFARFMEKGDQKEIGDIKLWLLGFARNIIYSKYQKEVKMPKVDIADWTESLADKDGQPIDEELISDDVVRDVNKELKQLHPAEQEVIILKVWQELTFAEIAEMQGQNENTVKAIYYRALDKMKKKLEKNYKQLNVITLPLLVAAIAKLKLEIAIPATLSNLFNFQNMDTLQTGPEILTQPSATGLKGLLATTKGKIIAGVVAATLVTGAAGAGFYLLTQSNTDPATNDSVTPTLDLREEIEDDYAGWELYSNTRYGFNMKHPSDWVVTEESNASCNMSNAPAQNGGPCQLVKFQKGDTELLVAVTSLTENGQIGISGLGAGELQDAGTTTFGEQSLETSLLVFEEKTKQVLYNNGMAFNESDSKFFLDLSSASADYGSVDISAHDHRTAALIIGSYKADEYPGWNTYENEAFGLSLRYPDSFTLSEGNGEKNSDSIFSLRSKKGDASYFTLEFRNKYTLSPEDMAAVRNTSFDYRLMISNKDLSFTGYRGGDGGPTGNESQYMTELYAIIIADFSTDIQLVEHRTINTLYKDHNGAILREEKPTDEELRLGKLILQSIRPL